MAAAAKRSKKTKAKKPGKAATPPKARRSGAKASNTTLGGHVADADPDLIERREVRVRVPQGDYFVVADIRGQRILIRQDGSDGDEELAALPIAKGGDLVHFFHVLGRALRASRRDVLRTDPGPIERFQPPPKGSKNKAR